MKKVGDKTSKVKNAPKLGGKYCPPWLYRLKDGEYSLTELAKISNCEKTSIIKTMKRFEVPKRYKQHAYRNLLESIFTWKRKDHLVMGK